MPTLLTARVVDCDTFISLLVESAVLGGRPAGRVAVELGDHEVRGLALSLDGSETLLLTLAVDPTDRTRFQASTVTLGGLRLTGAQLSAEGVAWRLRQLLSRPPRGHELTDRAARHALLFVLEARDPDVRTERLQLLDAAMSNAGADRPEST
jgi:hypothetical protein